ncbi:MULTISPECIES: restriction endonuclease subunit S [Enterobacterales]|uniref:restriction endonuclease subunit S n=1 Tax=Enterobacterales TaxID=91347 RepID=UPI001E5E1D4F|nr:MULTISPECIES: restriction endonuclease subunit S [Enterobacterales]MCE2011580.1 restriction endonuclease subunit S [Enterobacter ludwigii]MDO2455037.1 restriction endonuclease subunit S [Enterobacter asburiae]HEW9971676.1 restriction endonuclease subunit S [Enterobacter cloacae]HEW9973011.1 restriction endonuclease subunit S [Enterobacter cloacae]
MANEWSTAPLGELCLKITDGAHSSPPSVEFGKKMASVKDLTRFGVELKDARHISESDFNFLVKQGCQPQVGDVLIAKDGNSALDTTCLVKKPLDAVLLSSVAILRPDPEKLVPEFLKQHLSSSRTIEYLKSEFISGAAIPRVILKDFKRAIINVPPLKEQHAIAHILGTLDDKIELNQKQNQTLEAMARALFKAWFVDFEPIRAKLEGRWQRGKTLPGLSAHLYDLFPNRLVDSNIGEIPEGWEITSLSEYSSLNPESWTKRTRPEQIQYVDLSNTKWGRIECVTDYEADNAPSRAQRVLRPQDTIVGTVRPGNGSYAFISEEGLTGSTGFAVLRPLRRECSEFVYLAATSRENIERLSSLADGGAYPAVRPDIVSATQVLRVEQQLIKEFSRLVSPMLIGMADKERTSQSLAQLRDTLLPKLISGELRVPDAERIVGA